MTVLGNKDLKRNPVRRFVELFLILAFVTFVVPTAKHALFPDRMTRLERMLRQTSFPGSTLNVERPDELLILVTVALNGKPPITTEIYRDVVRELEATGDSRTFLTHSINQHLDGSFYLTRTRIIADADLERVYRLEVKACDQLENKDGQVRYDGPEPIFECAVPIQEAVCLATE